MSEKEFEENAPDIRLSISILVFEEDHKNNKCLLYSNKKTGEVVKTTAQRVIPITLDKKIEDNVLFYIIKSEALDTLVEHYIALKNEKNFKWILVKRTKHLPYAKAYKHPLNSKRADIGSLSSKKPRKRHLRDIQHPKTTLVTQNSLRGGYGSSNPCALCMFVDPKKNIVRNPFRIGHMIWHYFPLKTLPDNVSMFCFASV